jgi:hypothetical protein
MKGKKNRPERVGTRVFRKPDYPFKFIKEQY